MASVVMVVELVTGDVIDTAEGGRAEVGVCAVCNGVLSVALAGRVVRVGASAGEPT